MKYSSLLAIVLATLLITACGGGDGGTWPETVPVNAGTPHLASPAPLQGFDGLGLLVCVGSSILAGLMVWFALAGRDRMKWR